MSELDAHQGGCHCGAVRFTVRLPSKPTAIRCNCSICRRLGFLHLIVPRSRFRLEQGEGALQSYRFGTRLAEHRFCRTCGVESFYVPRSNPDGFAVHAGCVDTLEDFAIEDFDGAGDYEASVGRLAHLSRED